MTMAYLDPTYQRTKWRIGVYIYLPFFGNFLEIGGMLG